MNITSTRPNLPALQAKPATVKTDPPAQEQSDSGSVVGDIVYKTSRVLSGATGGAIGAVVGLPFGSFKGAVSENNQLSPKAVKMIRTAGAILATGAGLALAFNGQGAALGLNTAQALAGAAIAGPLVGVVTANAAVGLGEGLVSGISGGVKGAASFAHKGANIGMGAVDWIVQK